MIGYQDLVLNHIKMCKRQEKMPGRNGARLKACIVDFKGGRQPVFRVQPDLPDGGVQAGLC